MESEEDTICIKILGKLWINLMEGDPDIRIGYLTGYHYEPTEISTEADALLWLVTEIRKLGIKINPLLPEEQLHGKTIGRFVGEVGRMTTAGDILIKIKFEGFDSPACDYVRDTQLGKMLKEFTHRAELQPPDTKLQPSRFEHRENLMGSIFE